MSSAVETDSGFGYSLHLFSYEGRPRPESSRPKETQFGPLIWNGHPAFGFRLGNTILKAPEDDLPTEFHFRYSCQGDVDIQLHIGTNSERTNAELEQFATPITFSVLTYLNLTCGENLVPTSPLQILKIKPDNKLEYVFGCDVAVRSRRNIEGVSVAPLMESYLNHRTGFSQEEQRSIDAATKRFHDATIESDPVDRFCDLWECCEFIVLVSKAKGDKVSKIATELAAHTGLKKQSLENELKIRELYHIRNDVIHEAVQHPANLENRTGILESIASELIRHKLGVKYDNGLSKHLTPPQAT